MNRTAAQLLLILAIAWSQSGCVVVGYSSRGGWSVWPGGLGLLLMLGLVLFMVSSFFRR